MRPLKPMLGDLELQQVQEIEIEGEQALARHRIPILEGDFLQGLGRRGSRVVVSGVLSGAQSGAGLRRLREAFRTAQPLPFVSDLATATRVEEVLIEEMEVRELAGRPERFAYAFVLQEYTEPPQPVTEHAEIDDQTEEDAADLGQGQVEQIEGNVGRLEVQVDLGDGADYTGVIVSVTGETTQGEPFLTWSAEQVGGIFRFDGLEAGDYTVEVAIQ